MSREDRSLRGAAAVVGVTDDVSPDRRARPHGPRARGRHGARRARGRRPHAGRCRRRLPPRVGRGLRRVPRAAPDLRRVDHDGWLELRGPRRACGGGHRGRAVRGGGERLRLDAAQRPHPEAPASRSRGMAGPNPMAEWELPFGLRLPMGPYALAAARHMHEFGTHVGAAGLHRGEHPRVGRAEPAGPLPRPDHDRRRARIAAAGEPAAPARLLPRDRRRRGLRHDRARRGPGPCASRRSTSSARRPAPTTWASPRCPI